MAELDDYFSLVMDDHLAFRNMDRLPKYQSRNNQQRHRAYEIEYRQSRIGEVLRELEQDTGQVKQIHGNVLGLLEGTMAGLLQARDRAPDIRDDEELIREVLGFLQRVCVAAMIMGAEHESSVMALRFPRIQRASLDLIVETLRMVKEELAGKPFCNKRDAAEFLTKYIVGKESQAKGIALVMSAVRRLKWE